MERVCRIGGLSLIWVSVAVITLGSHLQALTPLFAEYQRQEIERAAGSGEEELLNPVGRMALLLSFTWQYACCSSGFFAALFTAGVFGIRALSCLHGDLALLTAGAFGLGCSVGAIAGVGEALRSFHWGFIVLGIGYLLSAVGLAAGAAGVVDSVWRKKGPGPGA